MSCVAFASFGCESVCGICLFARHLPCGGDEQEERSSICTAEKLMCGSCYKNHMLCVVAMSAWRIVDTEVSYDALRAKLKQADRVISTS